MTRGQSSDGVRRNSDRPYREQVTNDRGHSASRSLNLASDRGLCALQVVSLDRRESVKIDRRESVCAPAIVDTGGAAVVSIDISSDRGLQASWSKHKQRAATRASDGVGELAAVATAPGTADRFGSSPGRHGGTNATATTHCSESLDFPLCEGGNAGQNAPEHPARKLKKRPRAPLILMNPGS